MATLTDSLYSNNNGCEKLAENGYTASHNEAESPTIDIVINNVVCSFNVKCHLNLREIATMGANVEYRKENGMVTMKIRNPKSTANIWSSGKVTSTGSTSEDDARKSARRVSRILQKLGFKVRFSGYRVVNVLGTCTMPFSVKVVNFSQKNRDHCSYEPELHPGVHYRIPEIKASLKIFSTGSITVTAPSVENVQKSIEHIFPLVFEFRKERENTESSAEPLSQVNKTKKRKNKFIEEEDTDFSDFSNCDENDAASDLSCD